jgi:hypothetical protein
MEYTNENINFYISITEAADYLNQSYGNIYRRLQQAEENNELNKTGVIHTDRYKVVDFNKLKSYMRRKKIEGLKKRGRPIERGFAD